MTTPSREPGLRERKKQRTRETIARVALKLFDERGYDGTTLEEIAAAADVSRRTIFSYYASKEDILFSEQPVILQAIERALLERPADVGTLQAVREVFASFTPSENAELRKRVIGADPGLRRQERARYGPLQDLLSESIARDLGEAPDDLRPSLLAASLTAAFSAAQDRILNRSTDLDCSVDTLALFDETVALLRDGLDALGS